MKIKLFVLGGIIMVLSAGFSFYPMFQDFPEEDYIIPQFKGITYPNFEDLIIMNVYMECTSHDNFFSTFTIDDVGYCTVAQNWVIGLLIGELVGFVLMITSIFMDREKSYMEKK